MENHLVLNENHLTEIEKVIELVALREDFFPESNSNLADEYYVNYRRNKTCKKYLFTLCEQKRNYLPC